MRSAAKTRRVFIEMVLESRVSLVFGQKVGDYFLDGLEIGVANLVGRRAVALVIFTSRMDISNHSLFVDDETDRCVFAMRPLQPPAL